MRWYPLTMLTIVVPEQVGARHTVSAMLHRSSVEDAVDGLEAQERLADTFLRHMRHMPPKTLQ
jgi:hypothetical protein